MSADTFALYDAAYVLGALSPADRREFEEHLKGCAACAGSVAGLAGLPGLMSMVSVGDLAGGDLAGGDLAGGDLAGGVEPAPETLLPSLVRAVRREHSRRRLAAGTAAAAAACLVALGAMAVTGSDVDRPPSASAPSTSIPTTAGPTPGSERSGSSSLAFLALGQSPVTASARLVDMPWGTRIDLTCDYSAQDPYPTGGSPYALVVLGRDGDSQQVATWSALPDRELTVMGASSLARRDIAAVEIRTLSGRAILRLSL